MKTDTIKPEQPHYNPEMDEEGNKTAFNAARALARDMIDSGKRIDAKLDVMELRLVALATRRGFTKEQIEGILGKPRIPRR